MSVYSLSCPSIGCYTNFQCDPEFLNKIVAVAFVKKSYANSIDKTSPSAWMTSLFNSYLSGNGFLIFNTSGEKPKPDTATVSGRGMQTTKALAKTHTVNFQDMQGVVYGNVEWYNDMLASAQNYDFYYFTPNRIWDASGNYVTVIGDPVIGAELNTYQMADVSVQWVSKVNPLPYDFDTDTFLEGLNLTITASGPFANLQWTSYDCASISPDLGVTINQGLSVPTVSWEFGGLTYVGNDLYEITDWVGGDSPEVSYDTGTGVISISPVAGTANGGTGTILITAKSVNGCLSTTIEVPFTSYGCQ